MTPSANIGNVDVLDQLDTRLMRFVEQAKTLLSRLNSETSSAQDLLARRRTSAHNAVEHWSEAMAAAEEPDDTSHIESRLCNAEERLSQIQSHISKAEACKGSFGSALARVRQMIEIEIPKGRIFLRDKSAQLGNYIAVSGTEGPGSPTIAQHVLVPAVNSGRTPGTIPPPGPDTRVVSNPSLPADLADYNLPEGFCWFPLARISPREMADLPRIDNYPKVSYERMKAGLETLRGEILPLLRSLTPAIAAERLSEMDLATPLPTGICRHSIWNAFFGRQFGDYVRIEGFRGDFTITNGRHRVAVARDLGWTVIPAEVLEVD